MSPIKPPIKNCDQRRPKATTGAHAMMSDAASKHPQKEKRTCDKSLESELLEDPSRPMALVALRVLHSIERQCRAWLG